MVSQIIHDHKKRMLLFRRIGHFSGYSLTSVVLALSCSAPDQISSYRVLLYEAKREVTIPVIGN